MSFFAASLRATFGCAAAAAEGAAAAGETDKVSEGGWAEEVEEGTTDEKVEAAGEGTLILTDQQRKSEQSKDKREKGRAYARLALSPERWRVPYWTAAAAVTRQSVGLQSERK